MIGPEPGNPPIAVALRYDGASAPRVVAKGHAEVAERILRLAREHGVPLQDEPELAVVLARIPVGDEIPQTLYRAVAEVIAFAYLLSGKWPPGLPQRPAPVPHATPGTADEPPQTDSAELRFHPDN